MATIRMEAKNRNKIWFGCDLIFGGCIAYTLRWLNRIFIQIRYLMADEDWRIFQFVYLLNFSNIWPLITLASSVSFTECAFFSRFFASYVSQWIFVSSSKHGLHPWLYNFTAWHWCDNLLLGLAAEYTCTKNNFHSKIPMNSFDFFSLWSR